jgi:hypothetical protein
LAIASILNHPEKLSWGMACFLMPDAAGNLTVGDGSSCNWIALPGTEAIVPPVDSDTDSGAAIKFMSVSTDHLKPVHVSADAALSTPVAAKTATGNRHSDKRKRESRRFIAENTCLDLELGAHVGIEAAAHFRIAIGQDIVLIEDVAGR